MDAFKNDFIWGAAAAAYQIEGAAYEDGKGLSVWDAFCKEPGRVFEGNTGDTACDHYHRFDEDFALMQELGLKNYRFSFSWPRLMPNGTGKPNQKGIDFYHRLLESMSKHDIEPYATLFHWDYPLELFYKGGWLNPDSPDWFAEYTTLVAKEFGDMVRTFFTLNEPQCFIGESVMKTDHAPGIRFSNKDCLRMSHNALLAHGKSVQALRANAPGCIIGWAPTAQYFHPATDSKEDFEAARKATFEVSPENWVFTVAWWNDPAILGRYPENAEKDFGYLMPDVKDGDMKQICQPIDFLGQNIYRSAPVSAGEEKGYEFVKRGIGYPKTAFNWPVNPECLHYPLIYLAERYKLPLYVTENGLSSTDSVSLDGKVHDSARIDFIQKHLLALLKAIEYGVDVRGYFHWSIMDNFEWDSGYFERFGLIYIDFNTQERILKDSAHYYSEVIRENGRNLFNK